MPSAEELKKLPPDGGSGYNRLVFEKSCYLLQHARNPVDWFPWGEAAFAKARGEGKPIFLSVGYSTCHWCHVMERESFENAEVAQLLNRDFVSIKVDREERPDVDRIYMTYVQSLTGAGGWPMSVWLTPDLKPFYGGTYFPPDEYAGRPGLKAILKSIAAMWRKDRAQIEASGAAAAKQLSQVAGMTQGATTPGAAVLDKAYQAFKASYDAECGGFGAAPKFPRPVVLNFLTRFYARQGTKDALDMVLFTLRKMADGGMRDHLGGGFHRYSTDARWHVPHFEKMLYDQAQLACAYLDAWQITRDPFFAEVAREVLDYVRRDMTGGQGAFYSAEDADSPVPGKPATLAEGAFYTWQAEEIRKAVGEKSAAVFAYRYGVKPDGNVQESSGGELSGKNVLIVSHSVEEAAQEFHRSAAEIQHTLASVREKLFEIRRQRPRPRLDDKVVTAWNGLMISAFACGSQVLEEPSYLESAERAALFIRTRLYDEKTGRLLRRYRDGEAAIDGYAVDYAFLIQGLLDLYEASFNATHLSWAVRLQERQNELFWDREAGGFFETTGDDASILLRLKEGYDGAEPSPNAVSALNLLRLHALTQDPRCKEMAGKIFNAFGRLLGVASEGVPQMLVAFDFSLDEPCQIVIAGRSGAPDALAMARAARKPFLPRKVILFADGERPQEKPGRDQEFLRRFTMIDGKATAYVCKNFACQLPTTDIGVMVASLTGGKRRSEMQSDQ